MFSRGLIVCWLQEGYQVMLIFSMQGSGSFQGLANLTSNQPAARCPDLAGPNLGCPLPIKWIKYGDIPFQATRNLMNPYNETQCDNFLH